MIRFYTKEELAALNDQQLVLKDHLGRWLDKLEGTPIPTEDTQNKVRSALFDYFIALTPAQRRVAIESGWDSIADVPCVEDI